jgi:hypothetical protein
MAICFLTEHNIIALRCLPVTYFLLMYSLTYLLTSMQQSPS